MLKRYYKKNGQLKKGYEKLILEKFEEGGHDGMYFTIGRKRYDVFKEGDTWFILVKKPKVKSEEEKEVLR
jgi:hypothetical protein